MNLVQQNLDGFLKHAATIIDPNHENYAKFLTRDQIITLLDPADSQPVIDHIRKYIPNAHIEDYGDMLKVLNAPVDQTENLFQTTLQFRYHLVHKKYFIHSNPVLFHPHVRSIYGINTNVGSLTRKKFFKTHPRIVDPATKVPMTPKRLKELYYMPTDPVDPQPGIDISIAAFDDYYSSLALDAYKNFYRVNSSGSIVEEKGSNCLLDPSPCDQLESDLDVQTASGIASAHNIWFWGNPGQNFILGWAQDVFNTNNPPLFHSISYGSIEIRDDASHYDETDSELAKLSSLGLSVQVSSGDNGSPNSAAEQFVDRTIIGDTVYETLCSQVAFGYDNSSCITPNECTLVGMNPLSNPDCVLALSFYQNGSFTGCHTDFNVQNMVLLSNCTCSLLPNTHTVGSCTIDIVPHNPNDNDCVNDWFSCPLWASWPATSPWVTAVGATMMSDHPNEYCETPTVAAYQYSQDGQFTMLANDSSKPSFNCEAAERVCNTLHGAIITSGGGFSNNRKMPSWQQQLVSRSHNTYSWAYPPSEYNFYDLSNRSVPDVVFNGHNWPIFSSYDPANPANRIVEIEPVDGTSASSPGFTSFMAVLLATVRRLPGVPDDLKFGLLTPLLYDMYNTRPSTFFDIKAGKNDCDEHPNCSPYSYSAHSGWDPASGLGTPNFVEMVEYFKNKYPSPSNPGSNPNTSEGSSNNSSTASEATAALVLATIACLLSLSLGIMYFLPKLKRGTRNDLKEPLLTASDSAPDSYKQDLAD